MSLPIPPYTPFCLCGCSRTWTYKAFAARFTIYLLLLSQKFPFRLIVKPPQRPYTNSVFEIRMVNGGTSENRTLLSRLRAKCITSYAYVPNAPLSGFEPKLLLSKRSVLPLHYKGICCRKRNRTFDLLIQSQAYLPTDTTRHYKLSKSLLQKIREFHHLFENGQEWGSRTLHVAFTEQSVNRYTTTWLNLVCRVWRYMRHSANEICGWLNSA